MTEIICLETGHWWGDVKLKDKGIPLSWHLLLTRWLCLKISSAMQISCLTPCVEISTFDWSTFKTRFMLQLKQCGTAENIFLLWCISVVFLWLETLDVWVREFNQESISERSFTWLGVSTWRTLYFIVMDVFQHFTSIPQSQKYFPFLSSG